MIDLDALFERIGYAGPRRVDGETLAGLQRAFALAVPFENLDIHLGRRLRLEEAWLFHKIVRERRGGFCYELNGLYAAVLAQLGFRVTRLGVSLRNRDTGQWTSPFAHLGLRVDLEAPWLVDVGFGDAFRAPLRLAAGPEQTDGWDGYRLTREATGTWLLAIRERGGDWQARYRFDETPRALADFGPSCDHQQTSPDSLFRKDYLCCQTRAEGRVTITGRKLVIVDRYGRHESALPDHEAFARALKVHLGLDLAAIEAAVRASTP